MRDSFEEIAESATYAGLAGAVLAADQRLRHRHPQGVDIDVIGVEAWKALDSRQQMDALPHVLGAYVMRIFDEERAKQMDAAAADSTKTYLGDFDATSLWDDLSEVLHRIGQGEDVEVTVDAECLVNVLSELELLQHRLSMRDQTAA